jgi:hypothetical protein
MAQEWRELTRLTGGAPMTVERVRLEESGIAIEGNFELPPLARLPAEDQVFVMAFLRSHGSIRDMERLFGISYPTVKNRLNHIGEQFELVETVPGPSSVGVLGQLERGEISAAEAIERLQES